MADNKQNPNPQEKPTEKAAKVLGFDPLKRAPLSLDVLTKVYDKVKQEKDKEAEERAEGVVRKVIDLCQKQDKNRKDFEKADKVIQKEVNQLLSQLQAGGTGEEPSTDGDQQADAPKEQ